MSDNDNFQKNAITFFAETNFRHQKKKFGIKLDDRRRHMYILGKTGMGKTNMIENLVISDIQAGHGVGLIDPHGDSAEKILNFIPSHRMNDVVYFNPADVDHPVAFNILESVNEGSKHLVANGMMGVFKKLWPDVWSPRMEYILLNTILALLDYPSSTLMAVTRMLAEKDFRLKVVEKVKDPLVKNFWVKEFAKYNEKFAQEAIAPIQNKVGQFLSSALIRNIVGQIKSSIDMRQIMDNRQIFIANLSKGRIGEESMRLLGGLLITKLQLAAMERVDIPEVERKDFLLYVDEFQNFSNESFATILSEARKYRLDLIIAHQYIEQLDEITRAAILGNVGTLICFRIGAADAEAIAPEFAPVFVEDDLMNLSKYNIYLKLMIDGAASTPFSATVLPPIKNETNSRDKVIRISRERYSVRREVMEDKVLRYFEGSSESSADKSVATKPTVPLFDSACSNCNKPVKTPFEPDGIRPVYCEKCLIKARAGELPFVPTSKSSHIEVEQVASESSTAAIPHTASPVVSHFHTPVSQPVVYKAPTHSAPISTPAPTPVSNYAPAPAHYQAPTPRPVYQRPIAPPQNIQPVRPSRASFSAPIKSAPLPATPALSLSQLNILKPQSFKARKSSNSNETNVVMNTPIKQEDNLAPPIRTAPVAPKIATPIKFNPPMTRAPQSAMHAPVVSRPIPPISTARPLTPSSPITINNNSENLHTIKPGEKIKF